MFDINTVMRHYKNDHIYQIQSVANSTATNDQFKPTAVYYDIQNPKELWSRPISEMEGKFTILHCCTQLAVQGLSLPKFDTLIPIYNLGQLDLLMSAYGELYGPLNPNVEEGLLTLSKDLNEVLNRPRGRDDVLKGPFPFTLLLNANRDDFVTFSTSDIRNNYNELVSENSGLIQCSHMAYF